jgi:hypothetical protein
VPQIEELVSLTSSVGWKTQDSAQADAVNNALKELIGKLTKEVEYQTLSSSDVSDHCCKWGIIKEASGFGVNILRHKLKKIINLKLPFSFTKPGRQGQPVHLHSRGGPESLYWG